jgi:hypothetical protein
MKFRAIIEKDQIAVLVSVLYSLEKVGKYAVLYMTEDFIRFLTQTEHLDSIRSICEIQTFEFFYEYKIESNNSNKIACQFEVNHLIKSLLSGKNAIQCLLKLVKRGHSPCLCFETKSSSGLTVDITHDIPVTLIKAEDIVYFMPPEIPPPQIALYLSKTKLLRVIVERLSKFSKSAEITARQSGRLVIRVDGSCIISSTISGLRPSFDGNLNQDKDYNNVATVMIDIRNLTQLLSMNILVSNQTLLCK